MTFGLKNQLSFGSRFLTLRQSSKIGTLDMYHNQIRNLKLFFKPKIKPKNFYWIGSLWLCRLLHRHLVLIVPRRRAYANARIIASNFSAAVTCIENRCNEVRCSYSTTGWPMWSRHKVGLTFIKTKLSNSTRFPSKEHMLGWTESKFTQGKLVIKQKSFGRNRKSSFCRDGFRPKAESDQKW